LRKNPSGFLLRRNPRERESRGPRIIVDPTEDYNFHDCLLRSARHAGDPFKKVTRTRGKGGGGGKERTNEMFREKETHAHQTCTKDWILDLQLQKCCLGDESSDWPHQGNRTSG
jgi:hypothetical protein